MNWVLIANTGYNPIADYYTLGVTLVSLLIIIVALRGIIRGRPRKKEMDLERLIHEMKKIQLSKDGMYIDIDIHWWDDIFEIVRMAWKASKEDESDV